MTVRRNISKHVEATHAAKQARECAERARIMEAHGLRASARALREQQERWEARVLATLPRGLQK